MKYTISRRIFIGLMAVISFFVNTTAIPSYKDVPDDAISIVYADTAWGDIKLFLPETIDMQKPNDVLLTIHGGAWVSGSAKIFYDDCREAAKAGFIAASMNYSKIFNGASAADMVQEVGAAISALKSDLDKRDIPLGKLILAGHSAGAHIMLLYAYTKYEECPMDIAFVVSNCAPSDFVATTKMRPSAVGFIAYPLLSALTKELVTPSTLTRNAKAVRAVTPIALITPFVPPTIVVQGTMDMLIPYQCSVDLYNALQANSVDSVHITYRGAGHFLGDRFTEGNAARSEAFARFLEKYGS